MNELTNLPRIALSIRQPWAWLIVNRLKPIENRNWSTPYRGPLLIHASKTLTRKEFDAALLGIRECVSDAIADQVPAMADLPTGGFVGVANLVDCVRESPSPWFTGADDPDGHGFVLANARPITFMPWKGQLGFFNVNLGRPQA